MTTPCSLDGYGSITSDPSSNRPFSISVPSSLPEARLIEQHAPVARAEADIVSKDAELVARENALELSECRLRQLERHLRDSRIREQELNSQVEKLHRYADTREDYIADLDKYCSNQEKTSTRALEEVRLLREEQKETASLLAEARLHIAKLEEENGLLNISASHAKSDPVHHAGRQRKKATTTTTTRQMIHVLLSLDYGVRSLLTRSQTTRPSKADIAPSQQVPHCHQSIAAFQEATADAQREARALIRDRETLRQELYYMKREMYRLVQRRNLTLQSHSCALLSILTAYQKLDDDDDDDYDLNDNAGEELGDADGDRVGKK